jgi:undecaprenyl pyrophosphate phosphatase UppP
MSSSTRFSFEAGLEHCMAIIPGISRSMVGIGGRMARQSETSKISA